MIMISINFIFNFTNFCVIVRFLTKLLTVGVLFSTAVRPVVVVKLVISGILFLISFVLALRAVVAVNLVILGISFLISFYFSLRSSFSSYASSIRCLIFSIFDLALYTSFSKTSFFTTSLSLLLKSTGTSTNLSISNLSTLLFKLLKLLGTFFNLICLHRILN